MPHQDMSSTINYSYYTHTNTYPIIIQHHSVQQYNHELIHTAPQYLLQWKPNIYTTIKLLYNNTQYYYTHILYHICRLCSIGYNVDILQYNTYAKYMYQQLQQILIQLHTALSQHNQSSTLPVELMCVILLNTDNSSNTVLHAYIKPIVEVEKFVSVAIAGTPRSQPYTKHTQWIHDRHQLDQLKHQLHVYDIILHSSNNLYEGLIHNTFIVQQDTTNTYGYKLQTSNTDVLYGIGRDSIITVCKQYNILIDYTAPNINNINNWCGIILCNALHNIVIVDTVLYWLDTSTVTNDTAIQHKFIMTDSLNQFITALSTGVQQIEWTSINQNI